MAEENKSVDLTAQFDQLQTTMENTATVVSQYYADLVRKGIPTRLAGKLVMDFQDKLLSPFDKRGF